MKLHSLIRLLCLLLCLFSPSQSSQISLPVPYGLNSEPIARRAGRSLLSIEPKFDTELVASMDGTVHLLDSHSRRILWWFRSGSPIYSSYRAPINHDGDKENSSGSGPGYFIDCGDDWELYINDSLRGIMRVPWSYEDFIRTMPHVAEDGSVITGFKKTTVFEVDFRTGRLIRSLPSGPYNGIIKKGVKSGYGNLYTPEQRLHITRTDYSVQYFDSNSDMVLWNMTVAEFSATLTCQDVKNPIRDTPSSSSRELSSKSSDFGMPLSCQSKVSVSRFRQQNLLKPGEAMLPLPSSEVNGSRTVKWWRASSLILFLFIFMGFLIYYTLVPRQQSNSKTVPSKKKKMRKSGLNNENGEKKDNRIAFVNEEGFGHRNGDNSTWLDHKKLADGGTNGRWIGKLFVSNKEIAKGSNGTTVLEGIYDGRLVAVKRLLQSHHDMAFKEVQNLILSDTHPNIVRWYGVEYDQNFVYLALERCTCNLDDLIQIYSDSSPNLMFSEDKDTRTMIECKVRLEPLKGIMRDLKLWKSNGHPSPLLLNLMRNMVSGLFHLHELGIIHRDIKPQNVLIIKEMSICAKLSDMGISKRLLADMSSLGHQATGCGSSGWQSPEQLLHGRQTRSMDLFSLGCVLFFCISGGKHPFGDRLERDINIVKNKMDLFLVEHIPEAVDLFSRLLNPDPELRPRALEVLNHPLFWSSEMRLSFLRDTSDRVELEDRDAGSDLLKALENIAPMALGAVTKWNEKMEPAFIINIGHYRRYKYDSVRDLLRVMRNKFNHYRELPEEIQQLLGSVPDGFDDYFASRFPKLLIEVYKVVSKYCIDEECFKKYFRSNLDYLTST